MITLFLVFVLNGLRYVIMSLEPEWM